MANVQLAPPPGLWGRRCRELRPDSARHRDFQNYYHGDGDGFHNGYFHNGVYDGFHQYHGNHNRDRVPNAPHQYHSVYDGFNQAPAPPGTWHRQSGPHDPYTITKYDRVTAMAAAACETRTSLHDLNDLLQVGSLQGSGSRPVRTPEQLLHDLLAAPEASPAIPPRPVVRGDNSNGRSEGHAFYTRRRDGMRIWMV